MDPPASAIFTAVPSDEGELRKPLIDVESHMDDEASLVSEEDVHILSGIMTKFRLFGLMLGFFVQLLNVGGTTYLFLRWGKQGTSVSGAVEGEDPMAHITILLLTQADLYLYIFMWVCLTALLTKPGMRIARRKFFADLEVQPSKRSVFVMGVNFYIGVVVGVFMAWTGIDMFLGLPVPVLPMVGVLLFGLVISYAMVWCYDMEEEEAERA